MFSCAQVHSLGYLLLVAAAVATARKIGLEGILGADGNRCRDLVLAMLISRILDPVSLKWNSLRFAWRPKSS
jgi:hypothetical protein